MNEFAENYRFSLIMQPNKIKRIFVKEYTDEDIIERTDAHFAEIGYERVGYAEYPKDMNDPLSGTMIILEYSKQIKYEHTS
jgi:hypothetical protein